MSQKTRSRTYTYTVSRTYMKLSGHEHEVKKNVSLFDKELKKKWGETSHIICYTLSKEFLFCISCNFSNSSLSNFYQRGFLKLATQRSN